MLPTCMLTFQGLVFFNWKLAVPYGTRSPYVTRLKSDCSLCSKTRFVSICLRGSIRQDLQSDSSGPLLLEVVNECESCWKNSPLGKKQCHTSLANLSGIQRDLNMFTCTVAVGF